MAEPQFREVEIREQEVKALERENSESTTADLQSDTSPVPAATTSADTADHAPPQPKPKKAVKASTDKFALENARKRRADAKAKRLEAERALRKALEEVKQDAAFKEEAAREAENATLRFAHKYQATAADDSKSQAKASSGAQPAPSTPIVACRKMLTSLSRTLRRQQPGSKEKPHIPVIKEKKRNSKEGAPPRTDKKVEALPAFPVEDEQSLQAAEQRLDVICAGLKIRLQGVTQETFQRLAVSSGSTKAGSSKPGFITPMIFQRFVTDLDPNIKRHQAGSMWRRGDSNCDGRMDRDEFCKLFGDTSVVSGAVVRDAGQDKKEMKEETDE